MSNDVPLSRIRKSIGRLQAEVDRLRQLASELPALRCNLARIQASLKMLEINFCEVPGAAAKRSGTDPDPG